MKGKSSTRVRAIDTLETPSKSKLEPQLSGAYIRSLVKHLSSSTKSPKDQTNSPKSILEKSQPLKSPTPPPTNPKKQVRRRLHTSRPYQERLLNMAEARREIVTALKYHRASMKQANEQLQQIQSLQPLPNPNSNPNPNPNLNIYQPFIPFSYPALAPPPDTQNGFNFSFMNYQPLGLNLNFQGFNDIDATIVSVGNNNKDVAQNQPLSPHSSSSSSYSYSPHPHPLSANVDYEDANMHIAMGEKEMEEIRNIGEKHEIEWNDTMNLVNSAWWSNFLEVNSTDDGINELRSFCEGSMDANASHMNDCYLQDSSLPCLDIGEIEWSEVDWLL